MNGYEVFKGQTHSPHKRGTGEGLSIALHLFPHSNAKIHPPIRIFFRFFSAVFIDLAIT